MAIWNISRCPLGSKGNPWGRVCLSPPRPHLCPFPAAALPRRSQRTQRHFCSSVTHCLARYPPGWGTRPLWKPQAPTPLGFPRRAVLLGDVSEKATFSARQEHGLFLFSKTTRPGMSAKPGSFLSSVSTLWCALAGGAWAAPPWPALW